MERRWYGWQTLATDGAALAFVALASNAEKNDSEEALLGAAAFTFAVGAPIVHWAHGRGTKGAISLAMRVATPLVAFGMLQDAEKTGSSFRFLLGGSLLLAWIPSAIAIDAAVLAREEVPRTGVSIAPLVAPSRGGATLGLGGLF